MCIWPRGNNIGRVDFLIYGLGPLAVVVALREAASALWIADPVLLSGISFDWVIVGQAALLIAFAAWFLLIAAKRLRDLELPDYLSILVVYGSSQIAGGFEPPISNAILIALQGGALLLLVTIPGSGREEPSGD